MKIELTKSEIKNLAFAASQMEDEYYEWIKSMEGSRKANTATKAFLSGLKKLRASIK